MRTKVLVSLVAVSIGGIVLGALAAAPTAKPAEVSAAIKAMFPQGLIDANANPADLQRLGGKMVGLYFSAHWCPPCKLFTPRLVEFRDKNAADFEVVFVSADRSLEEHRKYMSEAKMPWLAVEYDTEPAKALMKKFEVKSIPTLVILSPDGKEITRAGRSDVANDANSSAISKWKTAAK